MVTNNVLQIGAHTPLPLPPPLKAHVTLLQVMVKWDLNRNARAFVLITTAPHWLLYRTQRKTTLCFHY